MSETNITEYINLSIHVVPNTVFLSLQGTAFKADSLKLKARKDGELVDLRLGKDYFLSPVFSEAYLVTGTACHSYIILTSTRYSKFSATFESVQMVDYSLTSNGLRMPVDSNDPEAWKKFAKEHAERGRSSNLGADILENFNQTVLDMLGKIADNLAKTNTPDSVTLLALRKLEATYGRVESQLLKLEHNKTPEPYLRKIAELEEIIGDPKPFKIERTFKESEMRTVNEEVVQGEAFTSPCETTELVCTGEINSFALVSVVVMDDSPYTMQVLITNKGLKITTMETPTVELSFANGVLSVTTMEDSLLVYGKVIDKA